jgi:hypothetical protein
MSIKTEVQDRDVDLKNPDRRKSMGLGLAAAVLALANLARTPAQAASALPNKATTYRKTNASNFKGIPNTKYVKKFPNGLPAGRRQHKPPV